MIGSARACLDRIKATPAVGVGLRSYSVPWLDDIPALTSFARFERALLAERVRAGTARAKKQGVHVGRPAKLNGDLEALQPAIGAGTLSQSRSRPATGRLAVGCFAGVRKGWSNRRGGNPHHIYSSSNLIEGFRN